MERYAFFEITATDGSNLSRRLCEHRLGGFATLGLELERVDELVNVARVFEDFKLRRQVLFNPGPACVAKEHGRAVSVEGDHAGTVEAFLESHFGKLVERERGHAAA